jgi:hypothetical protein
MELKPGLLSYIYSVTFALTLLLFPVDFGDLGIYLTKSSEVFFIKPDLVKLLALLKVEGISLLD